jgi:sugar phosphate isomerase/epimerase
LGDICSPLPEEDVRLGGPLFEDASDPQRWVAAVRRAGYSAAFCPIPAGAPDDSVQAHRQAALAADIVIAEVGAWSNPLSPDPGVRKAAIAHCQQSLDLADRIGARCCVNISGSRGEPWDGPHPDNLTEDTFEKIVETVREIIDAVRPTRSFYTLETMPWMYPDSAVSYLRMILAVNRPRFAVHLDPANLVCSPQRYFNNAALIRECFAKLGPYIKSCHAKDVLLSGKLTVHLGEIRPGLGNVDYRVYLQELAKLDGDVPLMLEHLPNSEEYVAAAAHIRRLGGEIGISFHG